VSVVQKISAAQDFPEVVEFLEKQIRALTGKQDG
jgi:prefoldin subunit 5